ncbi:MAG TPA: GFA family protein [Paracoccaceae bacterium]
MRGACLCGDVVFEVSGDLRPVSFCHCGQCRKTSGHYWAASSVPLDRFRLIRDEGLAWFRSSPIARRGFCRGCGASLFWQPDGEGRIAFSAGALEGPTGLRPGEHIFTEDAGDYYTPEGPPPEPRKAPARLTASCLCGGVAFSLPGPAGPVTACHCTQCRKLSGHYSASFDSDEAGLHWRRRETLAEYVTPGGGQRGFCSGCGSSLYFRAADGAFSVEAGVVDAPTGGWLARHIFVADKGDYYTLADGLPQHAGRE